MDNKKILKVNVCVPQVNKTCHQIKKPDPFKWNKKITNKFIKDAIKEGRE